MDFVQPVILKMSVSGTKWSGSHFKNARALEGSITAFQKTRVFGDFWGNAKSYNDNRKTILNAESRI